MAGQSVMPSHFMSHCVVRTKVREGIYRTCVNPRGLALLGTQTEPVLQNRRPPSGVQMLYIIGYGLTARH